MRPQSGLKFPRPIYATEKKISVYCKGNFCNEHIILSGLMRKSKLSKHQMSRIVRKPDFCLGENKGADQLRGNREADQRLCFRYTDSTIPLLLKSEISSF